MVHLTDREKQILKAVIQEFIDTALPVGSLQISQKRSIDLKPASVRRIMASLEDKGLLWQPHTSAGRVPTSMGYRVYVNELLKKSKLTENQEKLIEQTIEAFDGDVELFMSKVSLVLAKISKQVGIIVTPKFYEAILERVHLIPVSSNRVMVILAVKDQQVRTILVEVNHPVAKKDLSRLAQKINQRFYGKTLREIKNSFSHVMSDLKSEKTGLIRFFSKTADRIFDFSRYENYWLHGTNYLFHQPEFNDVQRASNLIQVLEDKDHIFHFMEKREEPPGIRITIGNENEIAEMQQCSVITSTYKVGDVFGVVGVIGPMRLRYQKVIPVVEFLASAITRKLGVA